MSTTHPIQCFSFLAKFCYFSKRNWDFFFFLPTVNSTNFAFFGALISPNFEFQILEKRKRKHCTHDV
jgi:hypothetical protein